MALTTVRDWFVTLMIASIAGAACAREPAALRPCIEQAAQRYAIPSDLIRAHFRTENGCGRVGKINKNGTRDLGCMQINEVNLPELAKLGLSRDQVIHNDCLNINLGAYYIKVHMVEEGDFWRGVGSYNTGRWTPSKEGSAQKYRMAVWNNLLDIWAGR